MTEIVLLKEAEESWKLKVADTQQPETDSAGNTAELEKMLEQLKTEKAEADTNVEFEFNERRKWEDKAEELEKELTTLKVIAKAQGDARRRTIEAGVDATGDDTGLFAAIDKAAENQRHSELDKHATAAADVTAANARAAELETALADSQAAAAADCAAADHKQIELEEALAAKQEILRITEVELATLKEVLVDADSDEDVAPVEKLAGIFILLRV